MQVLGTSVRWLMKSDDRKKQLQFCLLFGMAIGMLGHGFMFANKLMNHDELEFYSNIGILILFYFILRTTSEWLKPRHVYFQT